jgi:hypothetical protein
LQVAPVLRDLACENYACKVAPRPLVNRETAPNKRLRYLQSLSASRTDHLKAAGLHCQITSASLRIFNAG